jgi:hypothetical protein
LHEVTAYQAPLVRDLGSLGELTQSLLPSVQGAATPLAALSTPLTPFSSGPPQGETADVQQSASSSGDGASDDAIGNTGNGGGDGAGAGGGGSAGTSASEPAVLTGGEEGSLPFTGFAAGAVGAAGGALTGAGLALRRALRRT